MSRGQKNPTCIVCEDEYDLTSEGATEVYCSFKCDEIDWRESHQEDDEDEGPSREYYREQEYDRRKVEGYYERS